MGRLLPNGSNRTMQKWPRPAEGQFPAAMTDRPSPDGAGSDGQSATSRAAPPAACACNGRNASDARTVVTDQAAMGAGETATRPSRTWGALCCRAEWSTGPPLGGGMVLGKGIVRNSGADLQHAMGASWGPTHLLVGAHPTVQQPLHRALRGRRRDGGPVAT